MVRRHCQRQQLSKYKRPAADSPSNTTIHRHAISDNLRVFFEWVQRRRNVNRRNQYRIWRIHTRTIHWVIWESLSWMHWQYQVCFFVAKRVAVPKIHFRIPRIASVHEVVCHKALNQSNPNNRDRQRDRDIINFNRYEYRCHQDNKIERAVVALPKNVNSLRRKIAAIMQRQTQSLRSYRALKAVTESTSHRPSSKLREIFTSSSYPRFIFTTNNQSNQFVKCKSNVNISNHMLVNLCCIVVDPNALNQWAKIEQNWKQPGFQFHTSKATEPVRHRYRDSNRTPIKEIQCHVKPTSEWLETFDSSHEELECRMKTLLMVCKFRTPDCWRALVVYSTQPCTRQSEPIDRPQRKDLFPQLTHTRWERPRSQPYFQQ